MADELIENQVAETQTVVDTIPAEVRQMMAISLNNGFEPEKEAAAEQQGQEQQRANQAAEQEQIVDANAFIKENFGAESLEAIKSELEELRQFKANPTREELKFENEVSEKLAKAWMAGKTDEVFEYLNQHRQLEALTNAEVTDDTADEIIKLSMRMKYSAEGLNDREITYKFNKQYALPKEPVGDVDDEDFKELHAAWKEQVEDIKMSKIIDAKVAKRELDGFKQKLVLPEFNEQTVDDGYLQYKTQLEENQKAAIENTTEYKKYTPKVLETKVNFNDEANKIAFEFQFEPDSESFSKVIDTICDNEKFVKAFEGQDGNFDRKKFAEVIYYGLNKERFVMEAMKQAKNATMKQTLLADNSNTGGGRQLAQTQEPSELDKQMRASLAPYQRN